MSSMLHGYRASTTVLLDSVPEHRRLLYIFSALSGFIAIQMMHLALDDLELNLALSTGLICGYIYSYFLSTKLRPLTTYGVSIMSVIVSFYYFFRIKDNIALYGNYIGVLAGILIVLLAFKAFSPGDHRFIIMFSVVFLLYSSVASFDLKYMILLPLFLVFAGCTLYLGNQVDVAVKVSGTLGESRPVRFQGGAGFSRGFRFSFDWSFAQVLLKAVAGIILLSSIGYILAPHSNMRKSPFVINTSPQVDPTPNLTISDPVETTDPGQASGFNEIGLGDDMDLTEEGELTSNPIPVLKVRSHKGGYLRAEVYDTFTGTGWEKSGKLDILDINNRPAKLPFGDNLILGEEAESSFHVRLVDLPSPDLLEDFIDQHGMVVIEDNIESRNHVEVDYEILRQEITLLESQPAYYFAAYQPFQLENISLNRENPPRRLNDPAQNRGSVIFSRTPDDVHPRDFSFVVYSLEPRTSSKLLKQVYNNPPDLIREQYTQLPWGDFPDPELLNGMEIDTEKYRQISSALRNFATTRFAQAETGTVGPGFSKTWDVVKAVFDYLVDPENFSYSRSYETTDSELEVTESFCMPNTGTRAGYCRHFASAMAVLCRINGIPARLVTGYSPGDFSFVDNAYVYRASNAHAWVEIYFDGYGWLMFDPSPAAPPVFEDNKFKQFIASTIDFLQELFVLDPASTRETIMQGLKELWLLVKQNWKTVVVAVVLLILIYVSLLVLRYRVRQARIPRFVPESMVVSSYLDSLKALGELGIHPRRSDTARSIFRKARSRCPELQENFNQLLELYERCVFGSGYLNAQSEEAAVKHAGAIKDYIAGTKNTENA